MTETASSVSGATEASEAAQALTEWLREHLPTGWMEAIDSGDEEQFRSVAAGADTAALIREVGAAGWAQPSWPAPYGGRGLDAQATAAVEEVKAAYRVPRSFNILGFGLAAPTLLQWGTEEQKQFFLPRMAQGDVWCQLFSEPGNGSDVAGLATRAVKDGDEWVINGQKVWTSGAHVSKWGMLIARSDPEQPKHKGITYFIADMQAPGVEVRPLRQITGDAEFNEVFLSDVRIPDAWRVGPEGDGWSVAQTTLMNERVALSGAFGAQAGVGRRRGPARPGAGSEAASSAPRRPGGAIDLIHRARELGAWQDRSTRDRLMQLFIEGRVAQYNGRRAAARRQAGQPGPEGSVGKLFQTELNQRLQNAAIDLLGPRGLAWSPDDGRTSLTVRSFLRSRGNTIEGGTSEIQRNILGERVLGLPREPDASKALPWKDVPRN